METLIFKGRWAPKGSRIVGVGRKARGNGDTKILLLFAWSNYPLVPCSKMVSGMLTMRPISISDNLQFPIELLALHVGLKIKGKVYPTLSHPTLVIG